MKTFRLLLFILSITYGLNLAAQSVYTTKTGEKYHKTTCHYLKNSKKEITLEKALKLGYSACSVCKPSSKNSASKTVSSLSKSSNIKKTTATQCTAKTQSGTRCKRMTKNASGKCYQH